MAVVQPTTHTQISLSDKVDAWPVETDISSMVMPKRVIADALIECYERRVYPLFPVLHLPTFRSTYENLWKSQEQHRFETTAAEATFHATLNIAFALGCLNNSSIEPRLKIETADGFYRRARAIMPLDAIDFPTLEVVQYLVITVNYLLDAFVVTCKLFKVIDEAHTVDYGSSTQSYRLLELSEVLQLNEKIDRIEDNLPPHLRPGVNFELYIPRDEIFKLQADAIMIRILHLRLLLLRPTILAAARQSLMLSTSSPPPKRMERAVREEVSAVCIQGAISVINILHMNLHSQSQVMGSIALFVTLSAATVIVAASLVPGLEVNLDHDGGGPYRETVTKALVVLEEHRSQVEGMPGAKEQLEKFIETANLARSQRASVNLPLSTVPNAEDQQFPIAVEDLTGIDFSDPLWHFQWGDTTPIFDIPGPIQ
ncbi:putative Zn(2)-C6 fungal-type domain-containing protein [Seiridium cardinale]